MARPLSSAASSPGGFIAGPGGEVRRPGRFTGGADEPTATHPWFRVAR